MANDPYSIGGSLDGPASDKMVKFIDLCDTFHLPVVNFVDQPGFLIGREAEIAGTIRRGVRALYAMFQTTTPLGRDHGAESIRSRGRGARNHHRVESSLRVAVGGLGIVADRRRNRGGVQARSGRVERSGKAAKGTRRKIQRRALAAAHRGSIRHRGNNRSARHAADTRGLGPSGIRDSSRRNSEFAPARCARK